MYSIQVEGTEKTVFPQMNSVLVLMNYLEKIHTGKNEEAALITVG